MPEKLYLKPVKKSASDIVSNGPAVLHSMLLGTDGTNDPTITIYNGTDNTGNEVVPTAVYDASALGLNGFTNIPIDCPDGIYVEITTGGSVEVMCYIKEG